MEMNGLNSGDKKILPRIMEKVYHFNFRRFQYLVFFATVVLLGMVFILGWLSTKQVKEVVTSDFNRQQLVLAQHAAGQIEYHLRSAKKELALLGLSPSLQYFEKVSIGNRMEITYSSVREEGVLEIQYLEAGGAKTHLMNSHGYQVVSSHPDSLKYLEWSRDRKNRESTLFSEVSPSVYENSYHKLIMVMAHPVWQVSVDETNPVARNRFSGVLLFIVDSTALIEKITSGIRSGKTGYAWVINEKGVFLYHPKQEFTGKNAFEARREKRPTISFERINEIQKERMLKGEEGTSWYVSGWHGGREGEIKKLIAYAPIRLDQRESGRIWSVAVVAPVSEVEEAIHSIQVRQFLLQAIIIAFILFGGLTAIILLLNWSRNMEQEVGRKTQELKKSEHQYKSLVENAEDIIFTIDRGGKILTMNHAGRRFFQSHDGDLIGKSLGDICLNESSASLQFRVVEEVFLTKESRHIIYPVRIKDEEFWISTNYNALYDDQGDVFSVLGISRDVTEKRKTDAQMYHTEKLASLGTLAAGVAHEINNPLAVILGFTDLLIEKSDPRSESHDILKTIEKQGNNAKKVVENLLSFARYREPREEHVDVNRNIGEVLKVVSNSLAVRKIILKKELADDLPVVKGDPRELQQVFFNMINNAISAMSCNGKSILTIRTGLSQEDRAVEISFSDTGHGIKQEHRSKIFDPLFTTKNVGEGTGLGLSVSYGIITKYGGSISFETKTDKEAIETGTTFLIKLPESQSDSRKEGCTVLDHKEDGYLIT